MKFQMYIKPGIVGLCFNNQTERDSFWQLLGEHQSCAERFGERTIRFYPAKATARFSIPLETETPRVIAEPVEVKQIAPKPVQSVQVEAPVIPSVPAPIEPVAFIPSEPVFRQELSQPIAVPPQLEPPPAMSMPQIGSVDALGIPATTTKTVKPPDLRSRAGRIWKQKNQSVKQPTVQI